MSWQGAKDHVLNMSPRPSQQLNTPTNMARILYEYGQSPLCGDSEKDRCVDDIGPVPPDGAIDSLESSVELMKEIAILEVEILHMEHYLLSLYRKAFRHQFQPLSSSCVVDSVSKVTSTLSSPNNPICVEMSHNQLQGGIEQNDQRSHSHGLPGLYEKSEMLSNSSSRKEKLRSDSCHRSLADHLSASRVDDALKSPDKLSEDIVRCISSIYCRLADPRPAEKEFSASSSSSSTSSSGIYTPKNLSGSWSPCHNEEGRKHHEAQNDEKRYEMTMEVIKLCLDDASYQYASMMLQKFRSLVKILEKVDPRKMKREEKLTFWINIHNALVMHAYLAYGTRNYITNTTILKAAYNVGGYFINAYEIQSSILGIRTHYSAPWLQLFLSPGKKLLTGNTKHPYQIEYPEPLVHFALCSGSYSDPVLRVYRAKNVFEDLKVAQQEFIQTNVNVTKEKQIHMPKILSYFAKDMSLNMVALLEMVGAHLPEVQQKASTMDRLEKHTYWLQRISTFRYLIHKDVMQGMYL